MTRASREAVLRGQLARWQAGGLIDAAQAAAIEAAEARHAGVRDSASRPVPSASSRLPAMVEALGYLGAALAALAGVIAVQDLWPRIPAGAELTLAGCTAAVLLLAGLAAGQRLDRSGHESLGRLRCVLWLASAVSLACATSLITGPSYWDATTDTRLLVTEAVVTGYLAVLWWQSRAAVLHLALFAAAAALDGTAVAQAWLGAQSWAPGLGVWTLSLLWGIAMYRGYLASEPTGYFAAAGGLLVGAQLGMTSAGGPALAVATVAGLLTAGVLVRRPLLACAGGLGALALLPQVATRYLPAGAAAAVAILAVGLIILGVALWLGRRVAAPPAAS